MTITPQKPVRLDPSFAFSSVPGIAAATAFAVSDVLAKVILGLGSDVLTMLLLRSAVGVALMAAWLRFGPRPKADARVRLLSIGNGLLFAGVTFCLFKAIAIIDVPTAVLSYFVYPLLTGLVAAAAGLDRVSWRGILSAVLAFVGLAVMIGAHPSGLALDGVAYALGAALCRTGMLLLTRAFLVGADARVTTWYTQLSTLAVFVALSLATQSWNGPQTDGGWVAMIALGVTTTAGILFLFVSTVRIGPFRTALIMYLEPLLAMVLSALVLAEVITPIQGVGSAIMLAALVAFQVWR
jgi:drug/metabolite transporter (DMT)-like permease